MPRIVICCAVLFVPALCAIPPHPFGVSHLACRLLALFAEPLVALHLSPILMQCEFGVLPWWTLGSSLPLGIVVVIGCLNPIGMSRGLDGHSNCWL